MKCRACGSAVLPGSSFCQHCGSRASDEFGGEATIASAEAGAYPTSQGAPPVTASPAARLENGAVFGRYRILRRLGEGGMGVVYQAWDDSLGIPVALKLIRPEILSNAEAGRQAERRFKRELVLARQVTHRHVVRIHDLGEADGLTYFTMPLIEGQNLAQALAREGKLPVARALRLGRQIAAGLAAAHAAGIVHRDLKPENVMLETDDTAVIMDFGLARSADGPDLTMSGTVLGTLAYMAPEQARGEPIDQRVDVYAWGLMLYDMLAGRRRSAQHRDTMSELVARLQQPPPSLRSLEPQVPEPLAQIVGRCIEPDPGARFQTAADLMTALDRLDAEGYELRPSAVAIAPERSRWWRWGEFAALLIALVAAVGWGISRNPAEKPAAAREPVSVLIADFQNTTGDPVFDGVLEPALSLGIEDASFVTAFPRREAERVAQRIRPEAALDETTARLVSQREGIKTVIAGAIAPADGGYRVSVRLIDPVPGDVLAEASADAASRGDVLQTVSVLSARIRTALGDATPASAMAAARETFTAASLEAAREYTDAQQLANANRDEEAIGHYKQAVALDPAFGRAYSGWASAAFRLGRRDQAAELYKTALSLLDRMTEREKLRTLGVYYGDIQGNIDKAIETYEELIQKYPADGAGHNNLAVLYFRQLNFTKALEGGRRLLEIYPRSVLYRYNYALLAMYAGDFDTAASEAEKAIELNPATPKAYVALAMAGLARGDAGAARKAYERASAIGPRGASLASIGLADLAMYEGRFEAAVDILTAGIAADLKDENTAAVATKYIALAQAYQMLGRQTDAIGAVEGALKRSRRESALVPAGLIYIAAGRASQASALATELRNQLQTLSEPYAKLLEAEIALSEGDLTRSVSLYREVLRTADLWLARYRLGVAYVMASRHAEALSELEACLDRPGEATAVFLDDVPTYRYAVPPIYWLGRAQDGLDLQTAGETYRQFLSHRPAPLSDPLASDARRRLN